MLAREAKRGTRALARRADFTNIPFQARFPAPFAVLAIRCTDAKLTGIEYLPPDTVALQPGTAFAARVCMQIERYLGDPEFRFSLPLALNGTEFQQRVWRAICSIRPGATRSYGEIAASIGSAARAVGGACGDNPIPLVVPCHRVVAARGLGGFMHSASGLPITIKQWLLRHEGAPAPST
jgi:methylated-DNA-[protein]-cysteine S-methyltransferase